MGRTGRAIRAVRLALAFFTVVPVPLGPGPVTPAELAAARHAYPAAGLILGLALAAPAWLLGRLGAAEGVAAFLVLAGWVALSGGLHLDGVADTADGLFLHGDADRRLGVMRDPRVGSFGVAALALVLLGKYAGLGAIGPADRPWAVLGAVAIGRTLVLVAAGRSPYARPDGTGRILVEATTPRDAAVAAGLGVGLGVATAGLPGLAGGLAAWGIAEAIGRLARRRLGGVTGDVLGAVVEAAELTFLLAVALVGARPPAA